MSDAKLDRDDACEALRWELDARTVARVVNHCRVIEALAQVQPEVSLLAGVDPRWRTVQDRLRSLDNDGAALDELLRSPLGAALLRIIAEAVKGERRIDPVPPKLECAHDSEAPPPVTERLPVIAPAARAERTDGRSLGIALFAVGILSMAVIAGALAVALRPTPSERFEPSMQSAPHVVTIQPDESE